MMAWLAANAGYVAAAVVAALAAWFNRDKLKAKADDAKADVSGAGSKLIDAVKNSAIIQKAETIGGVAGNCISYIELKIASVRILGLVDPDKKAETEQALTVVITNLATAKINPEKPAAQ